MSAALKYRHLIHSQSVLLFLYTNFLIIKLRLLSLGKGIFICLSNCSMNYLKILFISDGIIDSSSINMNTNLNLFIFPINFEIVSFLHFIYINTYFPIFQKEKRYLLLKRYLFVSHYFYCCSFTIFVPGLYIINLYFILFKISFTIVIFPTPFCPFIYK